MWNYVMVGLISMLPIIELRGAIPVGAALGLPFWANFLLCVIGNSLPVPFILLFIRAILKAMKQAKWEWMVKIALWIEQKAQKHSDKVMKFASFGLFIFVAIPLPGTGAWTGALVAAMLNIRMKYAIPSIVAGVVAAGVLVTAISYGALGFLQFLIA